MRHLLLMTLLFSPMVMAQEAVTEPDEALLNTSKSSNPTIRTSNKLAEPTSSSAQHQQTDLDFLRERAKVSTDTHVIERSCGDFTCPEGTNASCLDMDDKVCPGSARCVDDGATCFDEYPCDLSDGFICAFEFESVK